MSDTTSKKSPLANVNSTVAIVGYICVAVGLLLVLGITFCILRRIRLRRAKKYIKKQRNHSIAMGPVLTSKPPTAPWKWKEVKANIKARRRGEERPYSGHDKQPKVAVISDGSADIINRPQSANVTNRPQSANVTNRPQSANVTTTLGQSHKKMYGASPKSSAAHSIKHERLQKRIQAKAERREMKERQKEIKRDLTLLLEGTLNGTNVSSTCQKLPGDEFPVASQNTSVTHVGPIRRESLQAIPNLTYLIEQSARGKSVHRSSGLKEIDIPQNLCTWEEEKESKGSSSNLLSARGGNLPSARGSKFGSSPRHVLGDVTVHHVTDSAHQGANDDITEL